MHAWLNTTAYSALITFLLTFSSFLMIVLLSFVCLKSVSPKLITVSHIKKETKIKKLRRFILRRTFSRSVYIRHRKVNISDSTYIKITQITRHKQVRYSNRHTVLDCIFFKYATFQNTFAHQFKSHYKKKLNVGGRGGG